MQSPRYPLSVLPEPLCAESILSFHWLASSPIQVKRWKPIICEREICGLPQQKPRHKLSRPQVSLEVESKYSLEESERFPHSHASQGHVFGAISVGWVTSTSPHTTQWNGARIVGNHGHVEQGTNYGFTLGKKGINCSCGWSYRNLNQPEQAQLRLANTLSQMYWTCYTGYKECAVSCTKCSFVLCLSDIAESKLQAIDTSLTRSPIGFCELEAQSRTVKPCIVTRQGSGFLVIVDQTVLPKGNIPNNALDWII